MRSWLSSSMLAVLAIAMVTIQGHRVLADCGYKSCPSVKPNMMNVHVVAHSHDDVGWLKTLDEYYYGSKNKIQHAGVQYILDNVVNELMKNPERRFIEVESAYFFKWYNEQNAAMRENVKTLVNNGQLEFAGGAWSMNDEAAVHYQSVIDQFTLGLKALTDEFGECGRPRVGWQIDPFGHSREMASMFAQMGFDGQFFARMDWVDKNTRLANLSAEVLWEASESLGESAQLFTGLLYNHYSAPPGFCFDELCSDEPIIDNDGPENNVQQRVTDFINYVNKMTKSYRSGRTMSVMVPFGDDFNYGNAAMNYKNMDKLIKYVNARQVQGSKLNLFYSTPSCYLKALHDSAMMTWPTKTEDFFPYSSDEHSYWTGYFTSRPTQKRFERDGNHFLQVVKQLSTVAKLKSIDAKANLNKLREAMGVVQHHDAITGTEKQLVSYDYAYLLSDGLAAAQNTAREALQKLTDLSDGEFESCLQLNISTCEFTQTNADNLVITLYNPLARMVTQYVRIPVKYDSYEVTDEAGVVYQTQLVPIPQELLDLPYRPNDSQYELVFQVRVVSLANFFVRVKPQTPMYRGKAETVRVAIPDLPSRLPTDAGKDVPTDAENDGPTNTDKDGPVANTVISNSWAQLTFDASGHLATVQMNGLTENIRQEFFYYKGFIGDNSTPKNRSSGAYIFRPDGSEVLVSPTAEITVYEGSLVKEVHQRFNDWVSQVIRIYDGVQRIEFEWMVGPIPIDDGIGKEVISRFSSGLDTAGVFWTDSNGREMLRRVRDEREFFKANLTERVSGNYYPITTRLAMDDGQKRIAILTDRSHGGTSMEDGVLELMLHRRLLHDDAFGVGEALNETAYGDGLIARGKTYLILNSVQNDASMQERLAEKELHLPYWMFFSRSSKPVKTQLTMPDFSYLPAGVHLMSLESFSDNERLIRFEHYLDNTEASSVTFNIRSTFDFLGGKKIHETTLDGNQALSDMRRFKFTPDDAFPSNTIDYMSANHTPLKASKKDENDKFDVTLSPMQIRTFIIKVK